MTDTPTDPAESTGDAEPTDEQLRSDEARRYRHRAKLAEAAHDEMVTALGEVTAQRDAAQRQAIDAALKGKFADHNDYWSQADLAALRGEDGSLDMAKVTEHANGLLAEHPHWRALPSTGAAPAGTVTGRGKIGYGPSSALDTDNVRPAQVRGWGEFLGQAASGEGASQADA